MPKEILEYVKTQRVAVLAIEMPDGSPHAATVHFAHSENPLAFIIQTSPDSRKGESLLNKDVVRASLVVGLEEVPGGKEKTLQIDGTAQQIDKTNDLINRYLKKFPNKAEKYEHDIFVSVTPVWWRFTDWSKPEGKTIFTSDGKISVKGKFIEL